MSDLPQIKRNLMSSIANLVNDILHKLLNDLGNLDKSQTWTDTLRSAQSPFKKLDFGNSS